MSIVPEWYEGALCAQTDPELWFPAAGGSTSIVKARQICAECPVRVECLNFAVDQQIRHGVWGGETLDGRRRVAHARGLVWEDDSAADAA